jgi:hypothetical protein
VTLSGYVAGTCICSLMQLSNVIVQTNIYHWWKPSGEWYNQMSRKIRFTPLVFWGRFGYTVLHSKIHVYGLLQCVEGIRNNMGFILDW